MISKILSRILSGLTAVLASVSVVQAQQPDYSFINLNASNSALSFNKAHVITQDAKGFVWIGTADGLNRYDGRTFKTFGTEELGTDSAFIVSLCADSKGNLWVGTDVGITWYNYEMDTFTPLTQKSDKGTVISNKVSRIAIDKDGTLWFAVLHQGLFSYDGKTLVNHFYENGEITLPAGIRAFFKDNNGVFYLALYFDDLYWSDDDLKTIHRADIGTDGKFFSGDDIMSICKNPMSNTLFIASNNRGLCEVDTRAHTAKVIIPNQDGFVVEAMNCDRNQKVWLSTTKGLYCYSIEDGSISHYTSDMSDPYSVSENHIFDTYTDKSGNLWVATYSNGIDYAGSSQFWFEKHYSTADGGSLSGALMRSMAADNDGNLWVASEEKGLYVYSSKEGTLRRCWEKRLPDNLFGVCHDDGRLWIGSFQGIYRIDLATGRIKLYSRFDVSSDFKDSKIYSVYRMSDSSLYFGTTLGLFKYDRANDSFHAVKEFDGIFIVDIIEDRKGVLWMASYADGVFSYEPSTGKIENFRKRSSEKHIPCDKVMSLFEDSTGRIWAASFGYGVFTVNESHDKAIILNKNTSEALLSNVFYKIVEDNDNCLWLSSDKGMIAFNHVTGQIRSFVKSDGLLDNTFNYNSAYKFSDGRIVFGSTNGFIIFSPSKIGSPSSSPDIILTDFSVNGKNVKPDNNGSYLTRHINQTQKIVLNPNDNSFGFEISIPRDCPVAGYEIEYILEGYDKTWRNVGSEMKIGWENVPAGRYILRVRGIEGSEHTPVTIVVKQKPYKSAGAILAYIMLLILSTGWLIIGFYRRAARKAEMKRKEYEHTKEEELFKDKLSFFASVIHEIKTPLTLIKTPLQNIISTHSLNDGLKDDLHIIARSSDYLDKLVKELLDFIRLEKHGYILEYKAIDLIERVNFLCFNFADMVKAKNIALTFKHEDDKLLINADDSGLNKILNNLIHNAVKYAETSIEISAVKSGDMVEVRFVNDGPVIPQSRREDIFKPFVRFDNSAEAYAQSFGIGLALASNLSELHGGKLTIDESEKTCFILTLPLKSAEQTNETDGVSEIFGSDETLPLLMIVEDNADLLEYLRSKLCDEYRILTAQSSEKALTLVKRYTIDMIVTDISLNGMSGIDLCAKVTSDFETSHIPVIILSAISNNDTKILCVQSGAATYIEKPFSMDYLKACLKAEYGKRSSMVRETTHISDVSTEKITVPGSDKDFIKNLDRIILDNITDPNLSNEQLAEALYISKATLVRKVKGLLGTTPNDYIRSKRLSLAAKMLLKDGYRISDICYSIGFNTPSYFAKCFKKQYGVLPAEYVKQNKNNNQQN